MLTIGINLGKGKAIVSAIKRPRHNTPYALDIALARKKYALGSEDVEEKEDSDRLQLGFKNMQSIDIVIEALQELKARMRQERKDKRDRKNLSTSPE